MWFDVEQEQMTTHIFVTIDRAQLWFDVEQEQMTTLQAQLDAARQLWFDVEQEQMTTKGKIVIIIHGCGLM